MLLRFENWTNKIFARDWRAFNLVLVECSARRKVEEEKKRGRGRREKRGKERGVKWIWHRARASDGVETGSEWIGLV